MHSQLRHAVSVVVLFVTALAASADNWSRFRGPNGTGVADDKGVPVAFSADKGILWKRALPGRGNSSPIVWEDRVFVHTATNTERSLVCFDAANGKTLWQRSVKGAVGKTHQLNTMASSTPATDGEVVVNVFWDGKGVALAAFDMGGKPLWSKDLGPWISQHGPGGSPILYKDTVIYVKDMDAWDKNDNDVANPSTVFVFNKKTGAPVWKAAREGYRACYSAPYLLEKPGAAPELIVTSTTSIRSYNPDNGNVNWDWKWTVTSKLPLRTTGSSLIHDGMLFACSGDGGGDRHMVAVKLPDNGKKATLAWENKGDFPYVPTLLV